MTKFLLLHKPTNKYFEETDGLSFLFDIKDVEMYHNDEDELKEELQAYKDAYANFTDELTGEEYPFSELEIEKINLIAEFL